MVTTSSHEIRRPLDIDSAVRNALRLLDHLRRKAIGSLVLGG